MAQRPAPSIRNSLAARFLHTTTHRLRAVMSQRLWAAAAVLTVIAGPALSQNPPAPPPQPAQRPLLTLDSTLLAAFRWRNIGPANMGGRVSSVTGIPSPSRTFFVAAAAGGIWRRPTPARRSGRCS